MRAFKKKAAVQGPKPKDIAQSFNITVEQGLDGAVRASLEAFGGKKSFTKQESAEPGKVKYRATLSEGNFDHFMEALETSEDVLPGARIALIPS